MSFYFGDGLPPLKRGNRISYYFRAIKPSEGLTKNMGPYPNVNTALAARETMRAMGYEVGDIADG